MCAERLRLALRSSETFIVFASRGAVLALRDVFSDAFQFDDRQVLSALVMADVEFQPYAGFAFDQRPRFGAG